VLYGIAFKKTLERYYRYISLKLALNTLKNLSSFFIREEYIDARRIKVLSFI